MASSFDNELETPEYENLASLANELVYRLPGCADDVVRKCISSVYRDFCKRTCVLKTSRKIELETGRNRYPLFAKIPDCVIDCVTDISINGRSLKTDEYRFSVDCVSIHDRLLPNSGETAAVIVTCVEMPKIGSEKAPPAFIQKYGDAITSGVFWKLASMLNVKWSNPQSAIFEAKAYENALTEARSRHYSNGPLSAGKLNFYRKGLILP